jgi:hypothetical protein
MRRLAHLSLSTVFLLICSAGVMAQENKCALTLNQSPEPGGLRLGMTEEQVRTRFKIIETEGADDYGVVTLRLDAAAIKGAEAPAVRDISIELIKARIVSIRLVYDASANAASYREFTERVSRSLKLSPVWKPVTLGSMVTGMMMECAGFKVSATLIGARIPVIYLSALEAEPTLSRRQAEKERRLRDFFKQ